MRLNRQAIHGWLSATSILVFSSPIFSISLALAIWPSRTTLAWGQLTQTRGTAQRIEGGTQVALSENSDEAANRQQLVQVSVPELDRWGKQPIACHFAVLSDTHIGPDNPRSLTEVMERLKPQRPDFIVILGDLTWGGEPESEKPRSFATLLDSIQRAGRPVHLAMGNTDVSSGDDPARIFEKATKMPPFDSFDCGGVHFIVLFTEKGKPERFGTVNAKEMAWLKADLSKLKTGTPIVLFSHHALHNDAKWDLDNWGIDNAAELEETLKPYHLIATFSGHRHLNRFNLDSRKAVRVLTGSMVGDHSDDVGPKKDGIGYRWVTISSDDIRTSRIRIGY